MNFFKQNQPQQNAFAVAINSRDTTLMRLLIDAITPYLGTTLKLASNFEQNLELGNFIVFGNTNTGINVQVVNSASLQYLNIATVKLSDYVKVFEKLQKFIESQLNEKQIKDNMNLLFLIEEKQQPVSKPYFSFDIRYEEVRKPEPATNTIHELLKSIVGEYAEDFGYTKKQQKLDYSVHEKYVRIGYKFYPIAKTFCGVKYITYGNKQYAIGTTITNEQVILK